MLWSLNYWCVKFNGIVESEQKRRVLIFIAFILETLIECSTNPTCILVTYEN